jgi:Tfp pilus assembly protein PilE
MTTVIIGTLSSIAIPSYTSSLNSAKQMEAKATILTLQTAATTFLDENGRNPKGWDDIDSVMPLSTDNGYASGPTYSDFTLPTGHYKISTALNEAEGIINFEAVPLWGGTSAADWNIIACINPTTGRSAMKAGSKGDRQVAKPQTDCQ